MFARVWVCVCKSVYAYSHCSTFCSRCLSHSKVLRFKKKRERKKTKLNSIFEMRSSQFSNFILYRWIQIVRDIDKQDNNEQWDNDNDVWECPPVYMYVCVRVFLCLLMYTFCGRRVCIVCPSIMCNVLSLVWMSKLPSNQRFCLCIVLSVSLLRHSYSKVNREYSRPHVQQKQKSLFMCTFQW